MMKKDYIAIAKAIRYADLAICVNQYPGTCFQERIVYELAEHMIEDNPKFDRAKFLAACGVAEFRG